MAKIKKLLNPFHKPSKLMMEEIIQEVLQKRKKDPSKTYCLVCFHKKDKKMIFFCGELKGDAIKHNNTYYYVDSKRIFETTVMSGKQQNIIPYVDLYEDITVAFTPYENIDTRPFSATFQDVISMHIEKGILENKKRKQVNLRKTIAIALIVLTGLYIAGKTFFG